MTLVALALSGFITGCGDDDSEEADPRLVSGMSERFCAVAEQVQPEMNLDDRQQLAANFRLLADEATGRLEAELRSIAATFESGSARELDTADVSRAIESRCGIDFGVFGSVGQE